MSKYTSGREALADLEKRVSQIEIDLAYAIENLEVLLKNNQELIRLTDEMAKSQENNTPPVVNA